MALKIVILLALSSVALAVDVVPSPVSAVVAKSVVAPHAVGWGAPWGARWAAPAEDDGSWTPDKYDRVAPAHPVWNNGWNGWNNGWNGWNNGWNNLRAGYPVNQYAAGWNNGWNNGWNGWNNGWNGWNNARYGYPYYRR
ncbi:uncharacterized protein LOC126894852 [Daktulosphaira vitifoliae]|uniref:uncharacterized protein LOC126894852 n=1 Tax=Daktulosphaira vitifoliae TaxID=58002 RepID=UPI0021AA62B8|nr:uncharacterized protein LOC126894852 [Daktulosphaira vitifoliae]